MADEAGCSPATQHQVVVSSVVDRFSAEVDAHLTGAAPPVDPLLVVALRDIEGDAAVLDERHRDKQPDWSYDEVDSGKTPAERHGEHRAPEPPEN